MANLHTSHDVPHDAGTDAAHSRDTAWASIIPAGAQGGVGMSRPAVLSAVGPDAARWLHSQLTSDVERLEPGQGSLTARVTRTGHLVAVASLHRLASEVPAFVLVLPSADAEALRADLDAFLFADDVTLTRDDARDALLVQGPRAADVLDAVFGPVGFEPWASLPEHAIRAVKRARSDSGVQLVPGTWAVRRSLGGDVGFVVTWPTDAATRDAITSAVTLAAASFDALVLSPDEASAVLEIQRIEAGVPRRGPETEPKRRLLPETGIEQSAVSYAKGCYLGQEVIARVRTYGSVPHLLRALVFDPKGDRADADALLAALPAPGAEVVDAVSGATLGQLASRTWSPVADAAVALAYLGRDARTPGRTVTVDVGGVRRTATVALLPLHSAPDRAARVAQLHDRAIRVFSEGREDDAIALLEQALTLDPTFADAYEAIGVMMGRAMRFHEAIDFFRRLEEVAPDEPLVNTNLSLYFMKIGDKQTAEDEAGKATLKSMARARGASATAVDDDLIASKRKDATRKREMFRKVLEIDADDAIALFGLGSALLVLDEAEEAAAHLARAIEVDRNNSAVYAARGKALEKLGRTEDAVGVYRKGVEVASRKGDLMPLKEMEHRLLLLGGR